MSSARGTVDSSAGEIGFCSKEQGGRLKWATHIKIAVCFFQNSFRHRPCMRVDRGRVDLHSHRRQ